MKKIITTLLIIVTMFFLVNNIFGQTWSTVGGSQGLSGTAKCLLTDNTNNVMYAGGLFTTADGITVNNIAKWNGTAWSAMGAGFNGTVWALAIWNNELYAGGAFTMSGTTNIAGLAKWNGSAWVAVGTGVATSGIVDALCVYNNELYLGGWFTAAGGVTNTKDMAKWNGTAFSAVGGGMYDGVMSLTVFNNELYAGGYFVINNVSFSFQYRICKLSGGVWVNCGAKGLGDANAYWGVRTMTVHNSALYAGGYFSVLDNGTTAANHVAKWNGSAWSTLGSGSSAGVTATGTAPINGSASYNTGLYVGGTFTAAGGNAANNIAMWDGTTWSALGSGLNAAANAFAVYQGALYVAGDFTTAGGNAAVRIAKWSTSTGVNEVATEKASVSNYPNPFSSSTLITVNTEKQLQNAVLTVFDVLGNEASKLEGINTNSFSFDRSNLSSGVYFYTVKEANTAIANGKLVVE